MQATSHRSKVGSARGIQLLARGVRFLESLYERASSSVCCTIVYRVIEMEWRRGTAPLGLGQCEYTLLCPTLRYPTTRASSIVVGRIYVHVRFILKGVRVVIHCSRHDAGCFRLPHEMQMVLETDSRR